MHDSSPRELSTLSGFFCHVKPPGQGLYQQASALTACSSRPVAPATAPRHWRCQCELVIQGHELWRSSSLDSDQVRGKKQNSAAEPLSFISSSLPWLRHGI